MILQLLVLTFIVLLTLFMATEGPLSAALLLASALFASTLAMGLYEPLSQIMLAWKPAYAHGVIFLAIFVVAFAVLRTGFDFLVRGDLDLPLWTGRVAAGALGFFTAMILIGTLLIGAYMLPLPGTILGYNRYPAWNNDTASNGLWLAPDAFTAAIWRWLSGGALGGFSTPLASIHPDLLRELDGYRHGVQYADLRTLPANLLKVLAVYEVPSRQLPALDIPRREVRHGKKAWIIRTAVSQGSRAPDVSGVEDYFRLTPTQVRLVTQRQHQYYPRGLLQDGRRFQPLSLDEPIVDDYRSFGSGQAVIQDWLFVTGAGGQPHFLEIKSTARVNLQRGLAQKQIPTQLALLPRQDYPQLPYNNTVLQLSLRLGASPGTVHLWIIRSAITLGEVRPLLETAFRRLQTIKSALTSPTSAWSQAARHTQGSPNASSAASEFTSANLMSGQPDSSQESWGSLIPLLLAAQVGHSTSGCMSRIREYFNGTLKPKLRSYLIVSRRVEGGAANSTLKWHVAAGHYDLLAWSFSASHVWISVNAVTVKSQGTSAATIGTSGGAADYQLAR